MSNPNSFEEAMAELEQIVKRLEAGGQDLEKSIGDYERGMALRQYCEKVLKEATLKIEKISRGGAAEPVVREEITDSF